MSPKDEEPNQDHAFDIDQAERSPDVPGGMRFPAPAAHADLPGLDGG
jgi:hypothetical protein